MKCNIVYALRKIIRTVTVLNLILNLFQLYYIFTWMHFFSLEKHYQAYVFDDTSCHDVKDSTLPSIDANFKSDKRIFFHEISCKGGLDSRQACAVESAARMNPFWRIEVVFTGPVHNLFLKGEVYRILSAKPNVKFSRVYFNEFVKKTPVEHIFRAEDLLMYPPVNRVFDTLRYIILSKFGGVYLDLDVVVVKSFDDLSKNWAAKQSKEELGAGAFRFSNDGIGRTVADAAIDDIVKNPYTNDSDKPTAMLYRALDSICAVNSDAALRLEVCQEFGIYDNSYFYPLERRFADNYIMNNTVLPFNNYMTHAHHIWSDPLHHKKINPNSWYAKLAKMYCPRIYSLYGDEFGI